MEFVDDYKRQKKLAERLRKSADALGSMQAPDPTVYTPATGAFPGQIQANWLAPLAQMASAYAGKKVGERADAAEGEAATARQRALQSILNPSAGVQGVGNAPGQTPGFNPAAGRPTAEQLMRLQELDLDSSALKMLMPQQMNAAAFAQAMASPEGRMALRLKGEITDEQYKQAEQDAAARASAGLEQEKDLLRFKQGLKPAPQNETSEFEYWMQQNPGAPLSDYYASKNAGKGGGGGTGKNSPAEKAAANERALNILGEMEALTSDKTLDTARNKLGSVLLQSDNPLVAAGGSMALNAAGQKMRALQLDAALEEASKLTPVSNTDFKALMRKYEAALLNPDEFKTFVKTYRTFLEKYGAGAGAGNTDEYSKVGVSPDTGVAESTDSGWKVRVKGAQ